VNDRSEESVAWAAGLFVGEGYIHHRKDGSTQIGVEMTDEDLVRRFADIVGCGNVTVRAARNGWRPSFIWCTADRYDVANVLGTLRPLLGERRGAKADEALARIQQQMR
jgi:hypothetical protein